MWSVGSRPFDVYLGTRAVAVCRGSEPVLAQSSNGFEESLEVVRVWLVTAPRRAALRLWLSGGLCRPFLMPAVAGVSKLDERMKIAQSMTEAQTGLTGECRLWLQPPDKSGAAVAIATQTDVLTRIERLLGATKREAGVRSIRPWWSDALRHCISDDSTASALSVVDCDSLTLFAGPGDAFEVARSYASVSDGATAQALLNRASVSIDAMNGSQPIYRLVCSEKGGRAGGGEGFALAALTERSF